MAEHVCLGCDGDCNCGEDTVNTCIKCDDCLDEIDNVDYDDDYEEDEDY